MTPWYLLAPAFATFLVGSLMSYADGFRRGPWYMPSFIGLGVLSSALWVLASKRIDDRDRIYVYSLVWDLLMVSAYYVAPALVFRVELSRGVWGGVGLMVVGMILVKIYGA